MEKPIIFVIDDVQELIVGAKKAALIKTLEKDDFMAEADIVVKPVSQIGLEPEALAAFQRQKKIPAHRLLLISDNFDDLRKADKAGVSLIPVVTNLANNASALNELSEEVNGIVAFAGRAALSGAICIATREILKKKVKTPSDKIKTPRITAKTIKPKVS